MDVHAIEVQPSGSGSSATLQAAYRPIYLLVSCDAVVGTDQPMYADVYFNLSGSYVYYKTLTSYSISDDGFGHSLFEFDVKDAAQEYLTTFNPLPPITAIQGANIGFTANANGVVLAKVLFRGSTLSGGVLTPNPTVPIQGTATTAPTSGTGTASNPFNVINATLLPNVVVDSASGLNSPETILQSLLPFTPTLTDQRIYGLSNIPANPWAGGPSQIDYNICPEVYGNNYGGFPILIEEYGTSGILSRTQRHLSLRILYWGAGDALAATTTLIASALIRTGPYYIPSGIQEIRLLSPTVANILINQAAPKYYRLYLVDVDASAIIFYSPVYKAMNTGIEQVRIWFQNYWGHFEQVSFVRNRAAFKVSSAEQFTPYPQYQISSGGLTAKTGRKRFNTRVQDELSFTGVFPEALMPWIKELLGSPYCLLDAVGTGLTSGIILPPYKLVDDNYTVKKSVVEGRINYEVTIRLIPAIDTLVQRN